MSLDPAQNGLIRGKKYRRRACDRCYKYKEKCNFEEQAEICTQCERSASTCTTFRSHLRQGRRPKIKPLGPKGSVQIWDIGGTSIGTSSRQSLVRTQTQTSQPSSSSIHHIPTSTIYQYHITSMDHPFYSGPGVLEGFYATYNLFMLGPSFAPKFRAAIQYSYVCSSILLKDIYTAIFTTIKWARHNTDQLALSDVPKATTSLQKLRTVQITGTRDAFAIIALGQTLAAFDLLTTCTSPTLILQYSLSLVKPWYGELSGRPSLDPVTITPILWDTVCCLVQREVPVIKFFPRTPYIVDRQAGLCTTLLPILYDLCVASHTLKCQLQRNSQSNTNALRQIEERLYSWHPEIPPNLTSTFSNLEILKMKTQASVYRTAGLLIAHRILNPIGTLDDIASSHANDIILECTKYLASAELGAGLDNITFPILMAALEIANLPQEIWKSITLLAVAPICVAKMSSLVQYVWIKRYSGSTSFLLDLVHSGPDFVICP